MSDVRDNLTILLTSAALRPEELATEIVRLEGELRLLRAVQSVCERSDRAATPAREERPTVGTDLTTHLKDIVFNLQQAEWLDSPVVSAEIVQDESRLVFENGMRITLVARST